MEDSTLKERLLNSQKSFDGLLSLIPAKMYYGEETSDQWKRKKQTKAEAAAARRNKLDPDSDLNRSVKEVMDEQAQKKRKRDQMQDGDEDAWSDIDGVDAEKPGEGLKKKTLKDVKKKQKKSDDEQPELSEKERRKEEKKAARKERKAERQLLREEEAAFQRQTIKGVNKIKLGPRETRTDPTPSKNTQDADISREVDDVEPSDMKDLDVAGLDGPNEEQNSTSAPSPPSEPQSPVFDTNGTPADSTGQAPSTTTSISSTAPTEKPKHIKLPTDDTNLRARLAAKLQALRDARKADVDGKPIRTRQELIEARRQKQAERKAHKKELRRQAKVEADQKREEALASARNSPGSILSPAIDLDNDNNFSFGRVGFGDGSQLSHDLTHVLNSNKKKGPSDPKTALQKLENQKKRLQDMNEEKRKDVEDKELWLTARRRAEGEKIKDDEKLLKKAVKRKETAKKKSEKDWSARKEGVAKSMKDRQKKREENIKKRRDEKLLGKAGKKKGAKKTKGRAGFEGSFMGGGKKK
ncbi:SURF6-domain-containing protein [Annulohypoxylon maeteangense]|uniref:SURF6-domain-containing protein n=1 Tax=Annulohypoxylon maeteangense TaxID=1927788 RepID=UPI00200849BE|nr:SURF6-domain-containing protein [Annulohypoxylon maeteangense]KAI0886609.1 SURF6-domain-containing protein [Annulohypoxylon maeteangense]